MRRKHITASGQQPEGRDPIVTHEEGEPGHLKHIALRLFLQRVEVPTVYAIAPSEGLLPADDLPGLEGVDRLKEATDDLLTIGGLHRFSTLITLGLDKIHWSDGQQRLISLGHFTEIGHPERDELIHVYET